MANRTDLDTRAGSMTKIRAEQIKSELELGTLAGDIEALTEQIGSIIGAEWKEQEGSFVNVQLLDLAAHISASAPAAKMEVLKDLDVVGSITGSAARVENLTAGAGSLVFASVSGDLANDAGLVYDASGDKLSVVGIVSGSGALQGASVAVDGAATIGNGMTVSGAVADFNAGITANEIKIDGDVAGNLYLVGASNEIADTSSLTFDGSKLAVVGVVSGSGALQGASVAVDGAATVGGTLDVTGKADFAGIVDVAGTLSASAIKIDSDVAQRLYIVDADGSMKDEANLNFDGSTLFVTGAMSVSSHLTVAGDLTVNGTTTTVNSTTLTVDDKNVELGSVATPTDVTAAGGGITLRGATDKTIIWNNSSAGWEFNQAISGSGAIRSAVSVSAPEMKIDGDVPQRLYIVGPSNEIKDEASLTFDGGKLAVAGGISGSAGLDIGGAALIGNGLTVNGAVADFNAGVTANQIKIDGDTQQRLYVVDATGAMKDEAGLTYNFVDLMTISGSLKPSVPNAFKVGLSTDRWSEMWGVKANLNGADGLTLDRSGEQRVTKGGSGDFIMSSSVAAGFIKFDDAYRGSQLLNSATSGLKLANSGEWATFATSYPTVDSILGAFNAIAAGGGAEKAFFVAAAGVAAETAVDVTAGAGMGDLTFAGLTKDNSMVFFNGQLLRSGSVAELAAPASADYSFDGGKAGVKFAFAVEIGDQLVVQKL